MRQCLWWGWGHVAIHHWKILTRPTTLLFFFIISFVHPLSLVKPKVESWRRQWHPTPVLLPGKSHGQRSLVGCSPWGHYESDTTEWLHFHSSLACIGEGNGNLLQCSCLENPRDRGAWWADIYGVAQSQTRLKWLSSSSSSREESGWVLKCKNLCLLPSKRLWA